MCSDDQLPLVLPHEVLQTDTFKAVVRRVRQCATEHARRRAKDSFTRYASAISKELQGVFELTHTQTRFLHTKLMQTHRDAILSKDAQILLSRALTPATGVHDHANPVTAHAPMSSTPNCTVVSMTRKTDDDDVVHNNCEDERVVLSCKYESDGSIVHNKHTYSVVKRMCTCPEFTESKHPSSGKCRHLQRAESSMLML